LRLINLIIGGGVSQLVGRRASNRKVAKPRSNSDAIARRCVVGKDTLLFSTLEPRSLPVVVAQADERHANRTASVLEWYDKHRVECNI